MTGGVSTTGGGWRRWLPPLVALLLLGAYLLYLALNWPRVRPLLDVSPGAIAALAGLVGVVFVSNGMINRFLYRALGVPIGVNEGIGLAAINSLANLLPISGGLVAKGLYLKQRYRLAYTPFLAATVALYVLFIGVNGLVGLGVLGGRAAVGLDAPGALVAGFAFLAGTLLLLRLPIPLPPWERLAALVGRLDQGRRLLGSNLPLSAALVGLRLVQTAAMAGRLYIAFRLLSQPIPYDLCLLLAAGAVLTQLVTLAPGGLGVQEAIIAALATLLGYDPALSVVVVGLDRLVELAIVLTLGGGYAAALGRGLFALPPGRAAGGQP